jgi:transcriptional regulator with AAA-type ATPase domain
MDTGLGKGLLEIAFGLMSIALVALLIGHSKQTAQVVTSISQNFGDLLNTVMLTGNQGVGRNNYSY